MGSPSLIHDIPSFSISSRPIALARWQTMHILNSLSPLLVQGYLLNSPSISLTIISPRKHLTFMAILCMMSTYIGSTPTSIGAHKSYDHDRLIAEHFTHAKEIIVPLLVHTYNRAICEGFPLVWLENITVPLLKSSYPLLLNNYRRIIIGHYLAKIFGSILERELSKWADTYGFRSTWSVRFEVRFLHSRSYYRTHSPHSGGTGKWQTYILLLCGFSEGI